MLYAMPLRYPGCVASARALDPLKSKEHRGLFSGAIGGQHHPRKGRAQFLQLRRLAVLSMAETPQVALLFRRKRTDVPTPSGSAMFRDRASISLPGLKALEIEMEANSCRSVSGLLLVGELLRPQEAA